MPPPPKFASFIRQKNAHTLLLLSLWFFVYIHQLSNARGCPFIKIWFNGSFRTSFTESYKIKQCFPHRPIRSPIFVYYSWSALYMRKPNYVGFSKTGSDTLKKFQSFRKHVLLTIEISVNKYLRIYTIPKYLELLWKSSFIGYKNAKYLIFE